MIARISIIERSQTNRQPLNLVAGIGDPLLILGQISLTRSLWLSFGIKGYDRYRHEVI